LPTRTPDRLAQETLRPVEFAPTSSPFYRPRSLSALAPVRATVAAEQLATAAHQAHAPTAHQAHAPTLETTMVLLPSLAAAALAWLGLSVPLALLTGRLLRRPPPRADRPHAPYVVCVRHDVGL